MKTNYHTHTVRCNHASGNEREYIEKAIERGLDTIGFSDHSPYFFDGDHYSNFRMKREQVEEYVSTLASLREEYKDKIKILIGYEAEYYPKYFSKFIDFIDGYGYDYLILGQHVLGNEDSHSSAVATDKEEHLARYVDQTAEGLASGKFLYFAHPDIINYTGDEHIYRKHITRLCENAKALGVPLEINMLGILDKRHYPSDRFFEIVAEVGNDTVIGCDAHWPDAVAEQTALEGANELAKRYGLKPLERLL